MQAILDHKEQLTTSIWSFYFQTEGKLNFTAGQYIELTLKHKNCDKRGDRRWFSVSSSPNEDLVMITTRFDPINGSSFKKALMTLKPGDVTYISQPMGDFVLPKIVQTPLVFVAGGIGITPFHSILKWLAYTHEQRPIKFIYGVNNEDDIIFQETFSKANILPSYVVKEPSDAWGGERGLLTSDLILGITPLADNSLVYVSGPKPMVEKIEKDLKEKGLTERQLVLDFFSGYIN
ncbi:MAG: FAD-dependent oxidoreductase [Candidatus Saccharimonadales bacterium]